MKNLQKYILLIIVGIFSISSSFSQEKKEEKTGFFKKYPFVNMTEFGLLFGQNKYETGYIYAYYPYYYGGGVNPVANYTIENRLSFSLQTFNGVYLTKKTAVGMTAGIDWYSATVLIPVALGIRQNIAQKREGGTIFYGSLDAGYGTIWANQDQTNYKTTGGLMLNPSLGFKLPLKSGSNILINIGYKLQKATINYVNPSDNSYFYESVETRNYNRLVLRMGLEF